jgi:hypothetical protein
LNKCTGISFVPVMLLNSSAARWVEFPRPRG